MVAAARCFLLGYGDAAAIADIGTEPSGENCIAASKGKVGLEKVDGGVGS